MDTKIMNATHHGKLQIGDKELRCAVLEDGSRIISKTAVFTAFDRTQRGRKKGVSRVADLPTLPTFIDANNLISYLDQETKDLLLNPIIYKSKNGREVEGYRAELIPLLCDIYLNARNDDALTNAQKKLAVASEIIVRSLAKVGIVALVDEATGYQVDRDKEELQKLLSKYISKDLLPWTKRFPDEFYKEIFRLRNWEYPTLSGRRPGIVGSYTNTYVYDHLPPGIKEELQKNNPLVAPGKRNHKHHQFLTVDVGNPHLEKQLIKVITLMQISDTWEEFNYQFNKVFKLEEQLNLNI